MRVALLGPGGQLGRDLVAATAARPGIELLPIDRARLDVERPGAVEAALGGLAFDALVNATSYHRTDEAEGEAAKAFAVNAFAVRDLARLCAARKAPFVQISTDYVFSGIGRTLPYAEEDAPGPLNVYGASKLAGEAMAMAEWPGTLVVRTASLFGVAGSSGKGGNFVETMIRVGREKGVLEVVDDIVMSPTATADLAPAILRLLEAGAPGGVWHVVNAGPPVSWHGFAKAIVETAGIDAEVRPVSAALRPTRARRPAMSALGTGRLEAALGALPPWPEALRRYLRARGHVAAAAREIAA